MGDSCVGEGGRELEGVVARECAGLPGLEPWPKLFAKFSAFRDLLPKPIEDDLMCDRFGR